MYRCIDVEENGRQTWVGRSQKFVEGLTAIFNWNFAAK